MSDDIHLDEWLAIMQQLGDVACGEGLTVKEIAERVGHHPAGVRDRIRRGLRDGQVTRNKGMREALDGSVRPTNLYQFHPQQKAKGKK